VNRLKKIMALALLAVWPLAMNHCKLESVPGFAFLQCAVTTADAHYPATDCDNCCAAEKSQCRVDKLLLNVPPPNFLPVFIAVAMSSLDALPAEVSAGILTTAPPPLFSARHFVSRTALPVRAPSFAS
jgi:hypothetical protein